MQQTAKILSPSEEALCFHCASPLPAGGGFGVRIAGVWRPMCCPGCEAVAVAIADRGLADYYRWREQPSARAEASSPERESLDSYDEPLVQARFVRTVGAAREATLLLEGIRCAACAWLIEQTLQRLAGVKQVSVNYANHRASVAWDPASVRLSAILGAVRDIGYSAAPYDSQRLSLVHERERRSALWRLFVAGFGMMQVMMYAVPAYIAAEGEIGADAEQLLRWAGLILTLPVVLYSAAPFFRGAGRDMRRLRPGMDVPVALGIAVAFMASAWSTLQASGPVYFDSVSMFVFLLLGGRYLELLARQRASKPLEHLCRVIPEMAHRLRGATGLETETIPVAALCVGDRVLVKPGETVPADGEVRQAATLSEALITGESRPLHKRAGERLIGGSVNLGSALVMRVTRVGADTVLSSIVGLIDRAMAQRPPLADLAHRAASFFVAAVLLVAGVAGVVWLAIAPDRALWVAVSVLIVTCPCALSLAAPTALTVATGELAARGVVATRGHVLEALAAATDFVFDKTGTLTHGRTQLLETLVLGNTSAMQCIQLAAAMEHGSEHPIAVAFLQAAKDSGGAAPGSLSVGTIGDVAYAQGKGLEALVRGKRHRLGRADYVAGLHGKDVPIAWLRSPHVVVWLGNEEGWLAAFQIGDDLRAGARETISALQGMGMRVHLLSGDDERVAAEMARRLGIANVRSGAGPADKLAYVRSLQQTGARVAMIGDGVNDAPVLAQADASIAMGGGCDLAQVQGDAVLLSDSLSPVAGAVTMARRTRAILRQNLGWALAYNLVAIPVALAGLVTPLLAGIGMAASSLLVVLNAQRLRLSVPLDARDCAPRDPLSPG